MKIRLIDSVKIIMNNPDSIYNYFGWPTAVKQQDGTILVGASGYRIEHICPFGKAVVIRSVDNGETYSVPEAVIDTVLDDRDTGLTVFGESGLIVTSFNNSVEFQRKNMHRTDESLAYIETVSPDDEAEALGSNFRISHDYGKTFGKIFKSPVTSPHGPVVLNDGTVLWVGNVYETYNQIEAHSINTETGETSFRGKIPLDTSSPINFNEPHIIQLPDGKIICHIRAEDDKDTYFSLYQSVSYDNGRTWSELRQIISDTSGAPAHLFMHSSGILISTFSHREYPYGIRMICSQDGGESWSEEFTLYENLCSDDLGYPSTVELEDGSMITVFYARETEDPPCVIMQQKWAFESE